MKKRMSTLLVVIMLIGLMSGCAKQEADNTTSKEVTNEGTSEGKSESTKDDAGVPQEAGEVNVMVHMTQLILGDEKLDDKGNTYRDETTAWLKFLAEDFTEETGIKVNLIPYGDMKSEVMPLLQVSDKSVDIFSNPNAMSREERERYLEPVMTLDEAKAIYDEKFVDGMIRNVAGDQVLVWSMGKSYNNGIAYNENVIKAVGYDEIPDTFDEFVVMCEKIRDAGYTPISLHRVENWPLYTVGEFSDYISGEFNVMSKLIDSDDPFGDSTELGQMIKIYTDFKAKKFFEEEIYADFGVAMDSVAHGKAGMMLFGAWVVPQLQSRVLEGTDTSDIKFDAAVDYGSGRHITVASEFTWGISKASENIDNAKLFLDYMSKSSDLIAKTGSINARVDVETIVPDLYKIINDKIEANEVIPIYSKEKSEDYYKVEEVLTDADLFGDNKYVGLLFDAYDVENPGWDAYDSQVKNQNEQFLNSKSFLGY